jgi:hypothetical protein
MILKRAILIVAVVTSLIGCSTDRDRLASSSHLFVWAGDADEKSSDFLAVLDVRPRSPRYGRVTTTLPVGFAATMAHHTQHEMPSDGILFANGFHAGRTFRIDLTRPETPRLLGSFAGAGPYSHPHSFVRLQNGHTLATFQMKGEANSEPGALVELDETGRMLRSSSAAAPNIDPYVRPYSLAVVPSLDRVVTTSADMHLQYESHVIQVWRLSDLSLIKTIIPPKGTRGGEGDDAAEPRVLADGRTVLVTTFNCGLYRVNGLGGTNPEAEHVYTFPFAKDRYCALPVVAGRYWIETVPAVNGLISLDVSNPSKAVEVSRLRLGPDDQPHWISLEPSRRRIVITGYGTLESRVVIAIIDEQTGKLSLDSGFCEEGSKLAGINFDREDWPHGKTGRAIPHGAVFSRD